MTHVVFNNFIVFFLAVKDQFRSIEISYENFVCHCEESNTQQEDVPYFNENPIVLVEVNRREVTKGQIVITS